MLRSLTTEGLVIEPNLLICRQPVFVFVFICFFFFAFSCALLCDKLPQDVSLLDAKFNFDNFLIGCVLVSSTGSAMVPLNRLPKGNVLDEWYPLLSPSHSKMEVGSIRVRSKFTVRNLPSAISK